MRLLFLNHNYRCAGTYYRAMPMAEYLVQRGHMVTLLTVSRQHPYKVVWSTVNGVHLGEMPNLAQGNTGEGYGPLDNLFRVMHSLGHQYDIIHMFDHKPNATFAGFAGRLRGARLVADWADWWGGPGGINDVPKRRLPAISKFEGWWEEKSKLIADGVVTISTVLQQRAIDIGCNPNRVVYIPTGAATNRIHVLPLSKARRRLNVPLNRKIVGFIGMGQGDLEIVMQALQLLPDVWLMVIGKKNPKVLELAKNMGIDNRLWQTGFIPDNQVSFYLACANLMCLPMTDRAADRGRLPNKLLDYMASGRPTIASAVGDVKQVLQKYQVGTLVENDQFASAINNLLINTALNQKMSKNARLTAETVFSWPQLIEKLENFYHCLIVGGKSDNDDFLG